MTPNRLLLLGTGGADGGNGAPSGPTSGDFDGVTGFTDFSEEATDLAPSNWTKRLFSQDTRTNIAHEHTIIRSRSLGGKVLLLDTNSDGFAGSFNGVVCWNPAGNLIGTTWEVLSLLRSSKATMGSAVLEDVAPSAGLYTPSRGVGMSVTALNNGRHRTAIKSADTSGWGLGTFVDIEAGLADGHARLWSRIRRDGARFRAKFWAAGTAEPAGWEMDFNDGLATDPVGWPGIMLMNQVDDYSSIAYEYYAITTDPDASPLALPADDSAILPNTGTVDMTLAALDAAGFVHYPLDNPGSVTAVMEDRVGSLHGRVLKLSSALTTRRGFVTWEPAGRMLDGHVLALVEVGGTMCGPGMVLPRAPVSSVYTNSFRNFSLIRQLNERVDVCTDKPGISPIGTWSTRWNTGASTGAVNIGERWWIRQSKFGEFISTRAWKFGDAEPGTWYVNTGGNAPYEVAGIPALGYEFAVTGDIYLEHLAWTDDPTNSPVNPPA